MRPVRIRADADADIAQAFHWYETERIGLGVEFREALRQILTAIGESPRMYPVVGRQTRRALLKRFPYACISVNCPTSSW